jgi:hypothetical protein
MNPDDQFDMLRLLTGYWPHPQMSDDETALWALTLTTRDFDLSTRTIKALADQGRAFRPNASEFTAAYRNFAAHAPRPPLDLSDLPELEETHEQHSVTEWRAIIRKQLHDSPGPRRRFLPADVIGGEV